MEWIAGFIGFVLVGVALAPGVGVALGWRFAAAVWWLSALVWLAVKYEGLSWGIPALVGLLVGGVLAVIGAGVAWLAFGARSAVRWPWLAAGVVVLVAGVGAWGVVSAESEPAALVADSDAAGPMCFCSMNAFCVGPRGGVYCVTDDGRKKYQRRGNK